MFDHDHRIGPRGTTAPVAIEVAISRQESRRRHSSRRHLLIVDQELRAAFPRPRRRCLVPVRRTRRRWNDQTEGRRPGRQHRSPGPRGGRDLFGCEHLAGTIALGGIAVHHEILLSTAPVAVCVESFRDARAERPSGQERMGILAASGRNSPWAGFAYLPKRSPRRMPSRLVTRCPRFNPAPDRRTRNRRPSAAPGQIVPSAVGLITGEALAGSWWSHPRGNDIFRAVSARRSSRRSGMQALWRQGYVRAPDALAGGRGRGAGG